MSVSTLVLLGLAVVWAIVLLPEAVTRLSSFRNRDSIRAFNHQLTSLSRPSAAMAGRRPPNVIDLRTRRPGGTGPTRVPPHVRKRRQEVLTVLGAAAVLTLLATVAFGGAFLVLHLLADALLVTYVVLLSQVSQPSARTRPVVAPPTAHPARVRDAYGPSLGRVSPAGARRIAN